MFKNKGFTLPEFLIASTIGVFMSAVLIQLYIANQHTYAFQEHRSRVQENLNIARNFINSELRQAVFKGCVTWENTTIGANVINSAEVNALLEARGVVGIDGLSASSNITYSDFEGNVFDVSATNPIFPPDNARYTAGTDGTKYWTTTVDADGNANPMAIPDSIYFMTIASGPHNLTGDLAIGDTAIALDDAGNITSNSYASQLGISRFAMVFSCEDEGHMEIIEIGNISGNTLTSLDALTFEYNQNDSFVYEIQFIRYEIYYSNIAGAEGLYLGKRILGNDSGNNPIQPFIAFIENMQIEYGIDEDNNNIPEYYTNANNIGSSASEPVWEDVISLRLHLVAQSSEGNPLNKGAENYRVYQISDPIWSTGDTSAVAPIHHIVDYSESVSPTVNPRVRETITLTIGLRNRLN